MGDHELGNKVLIRECNEEKDIEMGIKLERNCEMGSKNGVFMGSIMNEPLCRIMFFPVHCMLIAQMQNNGEVVGVIQGCIKLIGTRFGGRDVKLGCILGLRVSPRHRRMGIGLKLVKSIEEWMAAKGADYTFLATEEMNIASSNLFTRKCNYVKLSSLIIYAEECSVTKNIAHNIKIEKLHLDEAVFLYKNYLSTKDIYLPDIEKVLKEIPSLGTWVSHFVDDGWHGSNGKQMPSSWAILSIWNRNPMCHHPVTCLRDQSNEPNEEPNPLGFLFLYGLYGEGDRLGQLMESLWCFASRLGKNMENCKMIVTELGFSDPIREHVPTGLSISCTNDVWYMKKVNSSDSEDELMMMMNQVMGNVFVDPRDF